MSKVMAPIDRMAGPSSVRGGRGGASAGSVNGGTPATANLPPWSQDQPTPEDLTLYTTLSAYADALDALPLDLTRSFSDLRELDAVLGPHLNSLTSRLNQLTAIIEDSTFTPGERLLALKEVAEEARAYKMGGEDKIRVALNTAETIISHTTYIDTLLANLGSVPSLAAILSPTKRSHLAGHLADGTALAPGSGPGGNNPAIVETIVDSNSPTKKKRQGQTGGTGQGNTNSSVSSAAEKRANESASQQTNANAVAKKRKQAAQAAAAKARAAKEAADDTDGDLPAPPSKRPAVKRSNKANGASAHDRDDDGKDSEGAIVSSTSRSRGGRARNTNVTIRGSGSDNEDDGGSDTGSAAPRSARVGRAPRPTQSIDNEIANATAVATGDDADERRYCFCNNVSYGDMIGCDGDDCEREWFHLGCVGLLKPPQGTWYCDDCAQKLSIQSRNKKTKTKLAKTSGAHGGGVVETKTRTASGKR